MEDFFSRVYRIVQQVPAGRVTTYGAVAACLGSRGSARMVGWAMNASHHASTWIPAHRVVNRHGLLTGKHHFDYPRAMQELLENEGVKITDDQVVDFLTLFWDPLRELKMDMND